MMTFEMAEQLPVRTMLSGPSTGVVGAANLAADLGISEIITFDMGGTSSDVALVRGGKPVSSTGMMLDGRPLRASMLDINTVGAGGGSIAWIDNGGHLKVGPRSAGADPGPACYGQGNTEPTVTDANVVLGILNQDALLDGAMPIESDLSFRAVERLGRQLGLSVMETAQGIISVVTANMARAIRVISVQRGYDPADYSLVAFGGAGPLHSARLAQELGMSRTIIPQNPGTLSALGMLVTSLRADFTRSRIVRLSPGIEDWIGGALSSLSDETLRWFERENISESRRSISWAADLRYVGQNYELTISLPEGPVNTAWLEVLCGHFHQAHRLRYGYLSSDSTVELVTLRANAIGEVPRAEFPAVVPTGEPLTAACIGTRSVYLPETGGQMDCPVYNRPILGHGHIIDGPAIIEQYDTTSFITPGQRAVVDSRLSIITSPITDSTPLNAAVGMEINR